MISNILTKLQAPLLGILHRYSSRMFNLMLDADWRTCGTQVHGEVLSNCQAAEHAPRSELTCESADLLKMGVISSFHNVASGQYSHALTLAYTVTLAPRTGARNTTTLLRPSNHMACANIDTYWSEQYCETSNDVQQYPPSTCRFSTERHVFLATHPLTEHRPHFLVE